ncbi:hypothetical protein V1264_013637 [Littorina saxatilis]|uniref:C2H2-type domain-containing protein n=2 Tax=Littorina saxatilis TaxID=31220 RepID=A0AAN9BR18_9CAEN
MNTDMDTAARFITSLTKALQAVIHGSLDFSKHIEVGGYLYVRVDNSERVDYVLSEKLQKSDVNSMTFLSNSFHALPPEDVQQNRSSKEQNSESAHITVEPMTRSTIDEKPRSRSSEIEGSVLPHSSSKSPQHTSGSSSLRRNADHFHRPHSVADREGLKIARDNLKWPVSIGNSSTLNNPETPRSSNRTQSLTDFQTAFRSPPPAFNSQSQQSSTSSLTPSFSHNQNGSSSRNASSHPLRHHHQQQQQNKAGILPDASEMEVVHIKTEDEDDVFNIPLQCQQGGSETDALATQGKAPWLAMGGQQPFYFPYPRLARSQSWDRRMGMAGSNSKFPYFSGERDADNLSLSCKVCGKTYRSRQGLLFHERAKHQNVYNVYCPVCGKGFQQTTHMYGHMATHTNVKNFHCQACGAKYAHKTSLQQHIRSGSCRASHMGNQAGLDLSSSQILREFAPFNVSETPPRASPSHSQSQSPQESDLSQSQPEADLTLSQGRSLSFSHTDLSSSECGSTSFSGEENPERLSDQNVRRDHDMGMNLTLSGAVNRTAPTPSMKNEDQVVSLNMTHGNREAELNMTGTSHTECHNIGADLSKDAHSGINTPKRISEDADRHDSIYRQDSDLTETVSLSFTADDD